MSNAVDENGKLIMPAGEVDLDDESSSGSSLSDESIDEGLLLLGDFCHQGVCNHCAGDDDDDDDDEDDDDDDDDDEDDLDDEDDDDTYSSDDSSTTSTSSTINNQDNTRVCDCCYCEVFGHGVTPVAPTSRNFQEMRERLRRRLSKRRQERCQNDQRLECPAADPTKSDHPTDEGAGDNTSGPNVDLVSRVGTSAKKTKRRGKNNDKGLMGDSTIEEILNFINGNPGDKSSNKKKKDKSKCVNNEKGKSKSINTTTTSNVKESKYSDKYHQQQQHPNYPNGNNGNSHHNQGNSTRVSHVSPTPSKRQQQQHNNTTSEQSHHTSNNQNQRRKVNSKSSSEASTSQSTCSEGPNDDGPVVLAKTEKHRHKKKGDKEKSVNKLSSNNVKSQQHHNNNNNAPANVTKSSHASNASSRESSKANSSSLASVTRENRASNNQQHIAHTSKRVNQHNNLPQNPSSCDASQQATNKATNQRRKQEESFQTKVQQENLEDHVSLVAAAPDDVFKPRDIDLDDDKLDKFERELEAFKRFCLDSIPLVKKERVRIELKDSNCFKEFKDRPAIKSKISSDRGTKKSPQVQGKRTNGQYLSRDTQNYELVV